MMYPALADAQAGALHQTVEPGRKGPARRMIPSNLSNRCDGMTSVDRIFSLICNVMMYFDYL
jgi:hypothetical protein